MKELNKKELVKLGLKIRRSEKYKKWRARVLKRDLKIMSNKINLKSLQVHHKFPFLKILVKYNIRSVEDAEKCKALWRLQNGTTITKGEHRIISLIERIKYHTPGFFEAMGRLLFEHLQREIERSIKEEKDEDG